MIDAQYAGLVTMQPSGHIDGSAISYTAGYYQTVSQAGGKAIAKGVTVKAGSSGGNLVVHLVDDITSAGVRVYTTIPLVAGDRLGFVFDEIKESGTIITLTDITIWL